MSKVDNIVWLIVVTLSLAWGLWVWSTYDPLPNISPARIGADGQLTPLTPEEFKRLQDWMRRHKDELKDFH